MSVTASSPDETEPCVLRSDANAVATLTLNRPKNLNALSQDMLEALQTELDAIAGDESVRVVVLSSTGQVFSAGHNMKDMLANYTQAYQEALFARSSQVMLSILQLPQPVIARVNGMVTAAGTQLVATCDLAIAAEGSRFATSGINLGLFCSTPSVALSRNVARKHAMEMLLTGDFIDARRAYEIGLLNKVAPAADLDSEIQILTSKLTAKSAYALALGKQAFYRQLDMGVTDAYGFMSQEMARNMMDRDAAEGIGAFFAKRQPSWDQSRRDKADE